jgi:hypothetical protein
MKRSHYIILGVLVLATVLLFGPDFTATGDLLRALTGSGAPTLVGYQGQVVVDNAAYGHWVRWVGLCVNKTIMLHGIRERIYQEEADAAIAATSLSYVQLEELQPPQHLHHTER